MGKRRSPALYELVRVRQRGGPFAENQPSYAPKKTGDEAEELAETGWLMGGRTIRVPVGYVFVFMGLGFALLFGGYFLGYFTRNREIQADAAQVARNDLAGIEDPTLRNVPVKSGLIDVEDDDRAGSRQGKKPQQAASRTLPNPYLVDDWVDDPRAPGMNYFIVATQPPDEALKASQFLAERGLAIARLPVDNRGLAIVIVLEPVAPGEAGSPRVRQLEAEIKRLGRAYKREHGGGTDFESAYLKKYR